MSFYDVWITWNGAINDAEPMDEHMGFNNLEEANSWINERRVGAEAVGDYVDLGVGRWVIDGDLFNILEYIEPLGEPT